MMGTENNMTEEALPVSMADSMVSVSLDQTPQTYMSNRDYKSVLSGGLAYSEAHPMSPTEDPLRSSDRGLIPKALSQDESLFESLSDAVFTPYVGEPIGNGNSRGFGNDSLLQTSSSSISEFLTVMVLKPQKEQENNAAILVPGGNTYVTYLIETHTNIPEFGDKQFKVRRRFRDVVTLADRLAESYRGFIIPARPDKSIVESQVMHKEEFIEQRRIALEKYLRRLSTHPVVRKSKEFMLFLQVEGKLPLPTTTDMASRMLDGAAKLPKQLFGAEGSAVITPDDVTQPAKGGRDLLRMFKELKQYVTNDWRGAKPLVIEEDKDFLEKKEKLHELEYQLSQASQRAESLVKSQQELGETLGELGLAFIKISKSKSAESISNTHTVYARNAKFIGTAAVKHSRFIREANARAVNKLDQLHEYLSLMQAVHTASSDRSNALLTVQTLMSELSTMTARVENLAVASSKVFGGDKNRTRKAEELRNAIKVTEEARDRAIKEYEQIKENNRRELVRFEAERKIDFFDMLKGFVHSQIEYAQNTANVWTKVAEESSEYAGRSAVSPFFGFRDAD
ncbi:sorting nexin 2A isoform X1 [Cryptomeria japonica]|uniref:sorting nexin 2A isoform X1 n=1 Tax=Cryptomeria japonica TaxID=3369 RepID=UPI0025ABE811|nr:sorting nexin 2A isoform X1 [Cryptomeria japonica]